MLWVSELTVARWPPCADVLDSAVRHIAFMPLYIYIYVWLPQHAFSSMIKYIMFIKKTLLLWGDAQYFNERASAKWTHVLTGPWVQYLCIPAEGAGCVLFSICCPPHRWCSPSCWAGTGSAPIPVSCSDWLEHRVRPTSSERFLLIGQSMSKPDCHPEHSEHAPQGHLKHTLTLILRYIPSRTHTPWDKQPLEHTHTHTYTP